MLADLKRHVKDAIEQLRVGNNLGKKLMLALRPGKETFVTRDCQ